MVVTNALGIAFTATLLAASDAGVTFAFPEDGATNALAWAQLAPASRAAVCDALDFAPVPPALAATFAVARNELRRVDALTADERLDAEQAARRRASIRAAFARRARAAGQDDAQVARLLRRLREGDSLPRSHLAVQ